MHKEFLKSLIKIKQDKLGSLKNCTAVLGKSESGSIYQLLNGKSNNWWWKTISAKELTPDYYAIVLFISHIDLGTKLSLKSYNNIMQSKANNTKAPISSTICGLMISNIIFLKDAYYDPSFKIDFEINTEDNVMIKSIGTTSDNFCYKGLFDLRTCPFYCPISG